MRDAAGADGAPLAGSRARVFDERVDPAFAALFGPEVPDIPDVVAAALFEPNVERWGGGGGIGAVLLVTDRVRIWKAIRSDHGLADRSIILVTPEEILAFSAGLLRLQKVPRELGRWRRDEVVASAVPPTGPFPPSWVERGYTPPPVLRLETGSGVRLAEVRPVVWDERTQAVFEALTGVLG
jgi:hypothetical protein